MFIRHTAAGFSWALLILVLCSSPKSELPKTYIWDFLNFDKLAHMAVFCIQVHLLMVGFRKQYYSYFLRYHARSIALLSGIAYGAVIELIQMFFSIDRSAELADMAANVFGCFLGLLMFRIIYGKEFSY